MTEQALKPCPFCGGADIRFDLHRGAGRGEHRGDDVWSMCCYECGASTPNRYNEKGKALMVAAWNRRAEADKAAAGRDAVEFIYKHGDLTYSAANAAIRLLTQNGFQIVRECGKP